MCLKNKIEQIKKDRELKKYTEQMDIMEEKIEQCLYGWLIANQEEFLKKGGKTLILRNNSYCGEKPYLSEWLYRIGFNTLTVRHEDYEKSVIRCLSKHFPIKEYAYVYYMTSWNRFIYKIEIIKPFSERYYEVKNNYSAWQTEGKLILFQDVNMSKEGVYNIEKKKVKQKVYDKVLEWYHKNDFDKYGTKEFNLEYSILPKWNDINPLDLLLGTYFVTLGDFDEILLEVFNEEMDTHECALMILMYDYEKDGSFKECASVNKDFTEKGRDGGPYICRICLVKKDSPDYERFKANGSFEHDGFYGVFQDTIDRADETGQPKDMYKEDSNTNIENQEPIIGIIITNFPD